MEQEYNLDRAIAAAENEGTVGARQPIRRRTPSYDKFDQLAISRAEGEGMYVRTPQRRLQPEEIRVLPRPSEIEQV